MYSLLLRTIKNQYNMSLLIAGTMAFDAIETPFGKTDKIIGGSATYAAWSASQFTHTIKQISIIGGDFPAEEIDALKAKGVQFEGVEQIKDENLFLEWSLSYGYEYTRHLNYRLKCIGKI